MRKKMGVAASLCCLLITTGCCKIFGIDCDTCEEIETSSAFADLLLSSFESDLKETSDGETAYNIIHTVINIAEDFDCPEEVSDAQAHEDQLKLVFSDNEDFVNSEVVETQNAPVNQMTRPNANYRVTSEVVFQKAGFYILDNNIDHTNLVQERNETNNQDLNTVSGKGLFPDSNRIIHVTEAMLAKNVTTSPNRNKYIAKWKVTVTYD